MKLSLLKIIPILLATIVNFSCSKDSEDTDDDYKCVSCASEPIAVSANNAINKGIYKGVVIGSTGSLIFNIQNTANTITGTMVIDGNVVNLTCDDELNPGADFEGTFTGTLNGSPVIIDFHVTDAGTNPTITSATIPGHPNAVFIVAKETSDALLECYEGTYSITGDWAEQGTYNLLIARKNGQGTWSGISAENGFPEDANYGEGLMSGNNVVDRNRGGNGVDVVIATISGHSISGNFVDTDNDEKATVDVKGKRTL